MKCNLLVDASFILYKNTHTLAAAKSLYADLELSLEKTYANYIHKFPFDNIYIVADSRQYWRRKVYPQYKGKRKEQRDKLDIDWDFVFNTHEAFKEKLKTNNRIKFVEIDGAEADDVISYLIKESNKKGFSNIYVSSDGDLNQLVDFRLEPMYINVQWRDTFKNGKTFLPSGYKLLLNEMAKDKGDLFNMNNNKDFLMFLTDMRDKTEFEEVNVEEMLFVKMVQGDASDNIDSVFKTPTKSDPTKMRGIGKKGAEKIYTNFKAMNGSEISFLDDDWFEKAALYIAENKKVALIDSEDEIIENLRMNRNIIHLDPSLFPSEIVTEMKKIEI